MDKKLIRIFDKMEAIENNLLGQQVNAPVAKE